MILSSIALVTLDPGWPKPLVYLLFLVLGASCLGWNGIVHAECSRLSPPGKVSLVAGATSFFIFGGVMVGPPLFALVYGANGSYGTTFILMVVTGVAALGFLRLAYRQERDR
jgi:MFS family permease